MAKISHLPKRHPPSPVSFAFAKGLCKKKKKLWLVKLMYILNQLCIYNVAIVSSRGLKKYPYQPKPIHDHQGSEPSCKETGKHSHCRKTIAVGAVNTMSIIRAVTWDLVCVHMCIRTSYMYEWRQILDMFWLQR